MEQIAAGTTHIGQFSCQNMNFGLCRITWRADVSAETFQEIAQSVSAETSPAGP